MNASLVHDVIAQTDTGLVRSHNEDSLVISLQDRLVIVADGMGGYQAGEVASKNDDIESTNSCKESSSLDIT